MTLLDLAGLLGLTMSLLGPPQDLDAVYQKAEKLLEESRQAYENARASGKVEEFTEAGFKLEEARIKYLVLQEIGTGDQPKLAADRLRAVQQLSKLINDGRGAVGKPKPPGTEPAADGKPVPAPSPAEPAPAAPAAGPSSANPIMRLPLPETSAIAAAEKLVKSLFKDAYVKKGASEQRNLARNLLAQASKTIGDPPGLYVLYREAADASARAGDILVAMEAVEAICRDFDVDGMSLRFTTLGNLGKAAKTPEEAATLTNAYLDFAETCIATDLYDLAEKAGTAAQQFSKKSGDAGLVQKATARAKDFGEVRSRFKILKVHLEAIARNPAHEGANLEMGLFLCFVKGQWDLGLRFLAKGEDATLKGLATRELRLPTEGQELVDLAERWLELGEKEKSPLRKGQILAHVKSLFEAALPVSKGLLRARAEKALADQGVTAAAAPAAPKGGTVDLLSMVDPQLDTVAGSWRIDRKELVGGNAVRARIQIPYIPPDEYDLVVVAQRKSGEQTVSFGLSQGSKQWVVLLDAYIPTYRSAMDSFDGKGGAENETTVQGRQMPSGKPMTFEFKVRKTGVTVIANGKALITWQGDFARLSMPGTWSGLDPRTLVFGYFDGEIRYSKIILTPVSGQGQRLR